jgi:hypothetical protein
VREEAGGGPQPFLSGMPSRLNSLLDISAKNVNLKIKITMSLDTNNYTRHNLSPAPCL